MARLKASHSTFSWIGGVATAMDLKTTHSSTTHKSSTSVVRLTGSHQISPPTNTVGIEFSPRTFLILKFFDDIEKKCCFKQRHNSIHRDIQNERTQLEDETNERTRNHAHMFRRGFSPREKERKRERESTLRFSISQSALTTVL